MKLFELVKWGSPTDGNAPDCIVLARADSYEEALLYSTGVLEPMYGKGAEFDDVRLLGEDAGKLKDKGPIRGPVFDYAVNNGYDSWSRDEHGQWLEHPWTSTPDVQNPSAEQPSGP